MYRKILVGYDGSGQGRDALALGKLLAETQGGRLVVAGVAAGDPDYADLARKVERAAQDVAGAIEITAGRSPATALKELAEEIGADLIVLGSSVHGRLGGVKLGRTGRRLFQGAPCAVALTPTGFRAVDAGLRVIGVGFDGSEESNEALAAAIELGRGAEGTLRVLTVVHPPALGPARASGYPTRDYMHDLREHFRDRLAQALETVPAELRPSGQLLHGKAAAALAEEARKGVDLLCVGSRSHGPLRRVLLGSVSHELAGLVSRPMLVVPRGALDKPTRGEPLTEVDSA